MKITLAYLPEEQEEATADTAVLRLRHPEAKVKKSEAHLPYKHIYLTIKKPANLTGTAETP